MGPRWRMVLLVLAYLLYLFLGATIFSAIEHPIERSVAFWAFWVSASEHVLYLLLLSGGCWRSWRTRGLSSWASINVSKVLFIKDNMMSHLHLHLYLLCSGREINGFTLRGNKWNIAICCSSDVNSPKIGQIVWSKLNFHQIAISIILWDTITTSVAAASVIFPVMWVGRRH